MRAGKSSTQNSESNLRALAIRVDAFERYANPHAARIANLADELANLCLLADEDRAALRSAALAHDAGMLLMRRDYVARGGELSPEERIDLWRHPVIGENEAARLELNRAAQLIVRWHHEAWNGDGYPDALRGVEIPLPARILRVADAYAALTDVRPFRSALTRDRALDLIRHDAGFQYDPQIVSALLKLKDTAVLDSYAARTNESESGSTDYSTVEERVEEANASDDAALVR